MYNGDVRTTAGEYCWTYDDDDDDEWEGDEGSGKCSWEKGGENGSSNEKFRLSNDEHSDRDDVSSSPRRKTLLLDGFSDDIDDDFGGEETDGVFSVNVDDEWAIGVVKPPDELSINGLTFNRNPRD